MKSPIPRGTAALLLLLTAVSSAQPLPDAKQLLLAQYRHHFPIETALQLPPESLYSESLKILQDEHQSRFWINALIGIGLAGIPQGFGELKAFFENPAWPRKAMRLGATRIPTPVAGVAGDEEPKFVNAGGIQPPQQSTWILEIGAPVIVSVEDYNFKSFAPVAMGMLANSLREKCSPKEDCAERLSPDLPPGAQVVRGLAIEYLTNCSSPNTDSWSSRIAWKTDAFSTDRVAQDQQNMFDDLAKKCIEGLALTGDKSAKRILVERLEHVGEKRANMIENPGPAPVEARGYPRRGIESFESFQRTITTAIARWELVKLRGIQKAF